MSKLKPKMSPAIYAIIVWLVINAIFMALEVTVFGDSADLNNSILLILSVASIAGLLTMKKVGAALSVFTLIYAFSFNAFNVIYFGASMLNGTSAIINAVATVYMFLTIFRNTYN